MSFDDELDISGDELDYSINPEIEEAFSPRHAEPPPNQWWPEETETRVISAISCSPRYREDQAFKNGVPRPGSAPPLCIYLSQGIAKETGCDTLQQLKRKSDEENRVLELADNARFLLLSNWKAEKLRKDLEEATLRDAAERQTKSLCPYWDVLPEVEDLGMIWDYRRKVNRKPWNHLERMQIINTFKRGSYNCDECKLPHFGSDHLRKLLTKREIERERVRLNKRRIRAEAKLNRHERQGHRRNGGGKGRKNSILKHGETLKEREEQKKLIAARNALKRKARKTSLSEDKLLPPLPPLPPTPIEPDDFILSDSDDELSDEEEVRKQEEERVNMIKKLKRRASSLFDEEAARKLLDRRSSYEEIVERSRNPSQPPPDSPKWQVQKPRRPKKGPTMPFIFLTPREEERRLMEESIKIDPAQQHKTKMCHSIARGVRCKHKRCRFAHSEDELVHGPCKHGARCKYVIRQQDGSYRNNTRSRRPCDYVHPGETQATCSARLSGNNTEEAVPVEVRSFQCPPSRLITIEPQVGSAWSRPLIATAPQPAPAPSPPLVTAAQPLSLHILRPRAGSLSEVSSQGSEGSEGSEVVHLAYTTAKREGGWVGSAVPAQGDAKGKDKGKDKGIVISIPREYALEVFQHIILSSGESTINITLV